ncbi:MAG TPA: hypothetical protein VHC39_01055 [Rhizomicrobium sp.]|nr:hypothetical protein [Rhizomicrobium sp.]
MASENVLTHPFLRPGTGPQSEKERRREALSRTTSTVLAAALHVLFFFFFVFAVHPFDMRSKPIVETFLTLPLPGNNLPEQKPINPQPVVIAPPRIESAPIQIPKPPPIQPDQQRERSGNPAPPTDILGAVGRELACSAGSWEHLTSAERARCGVYPWRAVKLPNGSLVMVPRSVLPRLPDVPDTQFSINTGADRMQSDLQKGIIPGQGGCPILQNTPCLHVSPGMRDATGQN